MQITKVDKL